MTTGIIVGVIWGAWHLVQGLWVGGTYAGSLPLAVFVPMSFFIGVAQLTAYRVLMLWVYDRTNSLLVATLMHASLTASIVFVFTPTATGATNLIHGSALAGAMWIAVGTVAWAGSGQRFRRPLQRRMA